jgi:uncharacterized membrane protein YciS (DUF1049 family)
MQSTSKGEKMSPNEALGISLMLVALAIPVIVIGIVYYLKIRLEHKQIMAAIEKGTPLSELRPPKPKPAGPAWIRYFAGGIGMVTIALALLIMPKGWSVEILIAILCGVGVARLIRGLLYRKYQLQNLATTKDGTVENKDTTGIA